MKNLITNVMPKKSFIQRIKDVWNEPTPTDEEIKVNQMMALLFKEQSTEKVIDTLILFEEKAKERLIQIKQQANTDAFVTDFYLGTNQNKKISI